MGTIDRRKGRSIRMDFPEKQNVLPLLQNKY
jgi:hypothetical protein